MNSEEQEVDEDELADQVERAILNNRRMTSDELRAYLDSLKIAPNKDQNT